MQLPYIINTIRRHLPRTLAVAMVATVTLFVIGTTGLTAEFLSRRPAVAEAVSPIKFTKRVRKQGDKPWQPSVAVKPGDVLEWLFTVDNVGTDNLNDVIARDVLPAHVHLVPGSVRVINGVETATRPDESLANGTLEAGNYGPGSGFYVQFATAVQGDFEECKTDVTNTGYIKAQQTDEQQATANIVIIRDNCPAPALAPQPEAPAAPVDPASAVASASTPPPAPLADQPASSADQPKPVLPRTGPGAAIVTFVATTIAGAAAYQVFARRSSTY